MIKKIVESQTNLNTCSPLRRASIDTRSDGDRQGKEPQSAMSSFKRRTTFMKSKKGMQSMLSTDFDPLNPKPGRTYALPEKKIADLEKAELFRIDYLRTVKANREREFGAEVNAQNYHPNGHPKLS